MKKFIAIILVLALMGCAATPRKSGYAEAIHDTRSARTADRRPDTRTAHNANSRNLQGNSGPRIRQWKYTFRPRFDTSALRVGVIDTRPPDPLQCLLQFSYHPANR